MPLRIAVGERTWRQLERRPGRTRRRRRELGTATLFAGGLLSMALCLASGAGVLTAALVSLCMGSWWVE